MIWAIASVIFDDTRKDTITLSRGERVVPLLKGEPKGDPPGLRPPPFKRGAWRAPSNLTTNLKTWPTVLRDAYPPIGVLEVCHDLSQTFTSHRSCPSGDPDFHPVLFPKSPPNSPILTQKTPILTSFWPFFDPLLTIFWVAFVHEMGLDRIKLDFIKSKVPYGTLDRSLFYAESLCSLGHPLGPTP